MKAHAALQAELTPESFAGVKELVKAANELAGVKLFAMGGYEKVIYLEACPAVLECISSLSSSTEPALGEDQVEVLRLLDLARVPDPGPTDRVLAERLNVTAEDLRPPTGEP